MANISDDFIISLPGPSNPRNAFHTPINPVGLGFHPRIAPSDLPEPDESFYSGEGEWTEGASPVRVEDEGSQGEVNEAAEEEDDVEGSETSSVIFNHEADPEGWAKRLDELAGVLETSEVEARAIRWGPAIGHDKDGASLYLLLEMMIVKHT